MKRLIVFLATVFLLPGCSTTTSDKPENNQAIAADALPDLVVAVGRTEPEQDIIALSSPVGGIVREVYFKEVDQVAAGATLLQLDDDLEQRTLDEIATQIQSQRSQIAVEKTMFAEAQLNLQNKGKLLQASEKLLERGAETKQAFDDLQTEVKVLEVAVQRATYAHQLAESKLKELQARQRTALAEANKRKFISPFSGTLLNVDVNKGEAISQYQTYAEFAPAGELIVRAEVDELFSDRVRKGQLVDIVNRGSDEIIATGEVMTVSPYLQLKSIFSEKADEQEDRRVREVRIALSGQRKLTINAKVECRIKL